MHPANLFSGLAPAEAERLETLFSGGGARIERIVSWGQSSPPDFWYDQAEGEWVALLCGGAALHLLDPEEAVVMAPGDWLWIPPHRRHRVAWTAADTATVWLAVFLAGEAGP